MCLSRASHDFHSQRHQARKQLILRMSKPQLLALAQSSLVHHCQCLQHGCTVHANDPCGPHSDSLSHDHGCHLRLHICDGPHNCCHTSSTCLKDGNDDANGSSPPSMLMLSFTLIDITGDDSQHAATCIVRDTQCHARNCTQHAQPSSTNQDSRRCSFAATPPRMMMAMLPLPVNSQ